LKLKICLVSLAIACLLIPLSANASTVFETTGWILEKTGLNFEFDADTGPFTYSVTLSDLSETSNFGFEFLYLSITTATDHVGDIINPDGSESFTFDAIPGETYFANIFGTPGGELEAGLFGLEVKAVPIPSSLILFGSSILGMVLLRRRMR
jgi:hypothetical protein